MASKQQPEDKEQPTRECEEYLQKHNIQQKLVDCIVQLCVNRPENPETFLKEYFQALEKEKALKDKQKMSSLLRQESDDQLIVVPPLEEIVGEEMPYLVSLIAKKTQRIMLKPFYQRMKKLWLLFRSLSRKIF
jgi:hypothetical protein